MSLPDCRTAQLSGQGALPLVFGLEILAILLVLLILVFSLLKGGHFPYRPSHFNPW